jgi:hypothetical protein
VASGGAHEAGAPDDDDGRGDALDVEALGEEDRGVGADDEA